MTPLFSALVVVPGTALLLAVAFVVVRFFQPKFVAIRVAAVFVVGAVIGCIITAATLSFFVPATLVATWQAVAYLASLAIGSAFGGVLLVVFCIKRHVLTLRSSGPPQAASA